MQDFFRASFGSILFQDNVVALTKLIPFLRPHRDRAFSGKQFLHHHGTSAGSRIGRQTARALWWADILRRRNRFCQFALKFLRTQVSVTYGTERFDMFHQLVFPNTYFGWLSFMPRVGYREHLLRQDLGSRINNICAAIKPAGARHILPHQQQPIPSSLMGTRFEASSIQARKLRSRSLANRRTCKVGRWVWTD